MRQSLEAEKFQVATLAQAVELEKYCPVVLAYQEGLVAEAQNRIRKQGKLIEGLRGAARPPSAFTLGLYETDLERAEWLLKEYHRARLQKIQALAMAIANEEEKYQPKLSRKEFEFHGKYLELRLGYFKKTVTNFLIKPFQDLGVSRAFEQQYRQVSIANEEKIAPAGEDLQATVMARLSGKAQVRKNVDIRLNTDRAGGLLSRQEVLLVPVGLVLPFLITGEMTLL
jgi:hypothetical protein